MMNAKTFLEKRYSEDVEVEDAVHTALLTLKESFEGEMTGDNVEVCCPPSHACMHCPSALCSVCMCCLVSFITGCGFALRHNDAQECLQSPPWTESGSAAAAAEPHLPSSKYLSHLSVAGYRLLDMHAMCIGLDLTWGFFITLSSAGSNHWFGPQVSGADAV